MLPNTLSARISFEFRWKSQKTTFSMVLRNKTFYLALSLSCSVVSENIFELGPETFDYCWVGDLNSCTCTVQIGWQCFFILCPPRKVWTPRETRCSLEGVYHSKSEKKVLTNSPVAITVLQQALRNLFGPICLFLCFFFFLFGAFYLHLLWTPTFSTAACPCIFLCRKCLCQSEVL